MLLAIETTLEHNPEYGYRYYNGTERRNFVRDKMGPIVLACYDKLIPNAFKADLFRYSAIYTLGGCYTDIGFIFVGHLRDVIRS
jgi:mannosyltransferase OCH1-like enzyme